MTTSTLITHARTLLTELQHRRTLAIAAGQRPLADALLTLSCEHETLLGKLLTVYQEPEYHYLVLGEVLQEGDEVQTSNGDWIETHLAGEVVDEPSEYYYRRRIIPTADMDTLCRFHAEQCGEEQGMTPEFAEEMASMVKTHERGDMQTTEDLKKLIPVLQFLANFNARMGFSPECGYYAQMADRARGYLTARQSK